MKTRQGFVSNSSSSSFLLKTTFEIDNSNVESLIINHTNNSLVNLEDDDSDSVSLTRLAHHLMHCIDSGEVITKKNFIEHLPKISDIAKGGYPITEAEVAHIVAFGELDVFFGHDRRIKLVEQLVNVNNLTPKKASSGYTSWIPAETYYRLLREAGLSEQLNLILNKLEADLLLEKEEIKVKYWPIAEKIRDLVFSENPDNRFYLFEVEDHGEAGSALCYDDCISPEYLIRKERW